MSAQSTAAKLDALERRLNQGLRAYGSTPPNTSLRNALAAAQRTKALAGAEIARRGQAEIARASNKAAQIREDAETWLVSTPTPAPRTPSFPETRAPRPFPQSARARPQPVPRPRQPRQARRPMYPTAAQRYRAQVSEAAQWNKLERATRGYGRNPRRSQNDRTRAAVREFRDIVMRARRSSPAVYRELTAGQRQDTLATRVAGETRVIPLFFPKVALAADAPVQKKPRGGLHREARRLGVEAGDVARLLLSNRRVLRTRR
jgi:hypothetical protein